MNDTYEKMTPKEWLRGGDNQRNNNNRRNFGNNNNGGDNGGGFKRKFNKRPQWRKPRVTDYDPEETLRQQEREWLVLCDKFELYREDFVKIDGGEYLGYSHKLKKSYVDEFKSLTEAQETMKSILPRAHRWYIRFVDQRGLAHYQRWEGDFHDMFAYDDRYAKACNFVPDDGKERRFAIKVDEPFSRNTLGD